MAREMSSVTTILQRESEHGNCVEDSQVRGNILLFRACGLVGDELLVDGAGHGDFVGRSRRQEDSETWFSESLCLG